MKKLLTTILLTAATLASLAQTTITTSVTTPAVITQAKFDSLMTVWKAQGDAFFHALTIPVTVTVPTTPPPPPPTTSTGNYTVSSPVSLNGKSNQTVRGLSINANNDSVNLIYLYNCSNIHITGCRLVNTRSFGIYMVNCTNITVDSNYFSYVAGGVTTNNCKTIKVNRNQMKNINGNNSWKGHAVQFISNPASGGNQINFNRVENINGTAIKPHDMLNVYHSYGLPGDSIQVIGNFVRGGQISYYGLTASQVGAAGIVLGDQYGDYQVARYDTIINAAGVGIQTVGTGKGIKIDHNVIYINSALGAGTITNKLGISIQDPTSGTNVSYNRVYVKDNAGYAGIKSDGEPQYWNPSSTPSIIGWSTNTWADGTISAGLLSLLLITKN